MSRFAFPFASPFGSGFSFAPAPSVGVTGETAAAGSAATDMLVDPGTLDYVTTPDGAWAETADSRTLMMIALELELGASPFDPQDGTTMAALRASGDPITPDEIESEAIRVGEQLQREGIIADFSATVRNRAGELQRDAAGRLVVSLFWRDLASGSPVDLAIAG